MKHRIHQHEIQWDEPEAFTLVPQTTLDGDRIAKERAQREADQQAAEKQQSNLFAEG
jgi:hypothetical protein